MIRINEKPSPKRLTGTIKLSAGQKVSKTYRKMYLKKLRKREYTKLRKIVPSVADKQKVSKVTVIEEAIKYIDELHGALALRLRQRGITTDVNQDNIMDIVKLMMPQNLMKPVTICEKVNYQRPQALSSSDMYNMKNGRQSQFMKHRKMF